jgi:hypothetical protein
MIERERYWAGGRAAASLGRAARGGSRPLLFATAVVLLAAGPVVLALTDPYMEVQPTALLVSTAAGALAVSALVLQPLLAAWASGRRRLRAHQTLGSVTLGLVLVHVGALFAVEVDHTLFSMSPDGPTRARMALIALLALLASSPWEHCAPGCPWPPRPGGSCTPTSPPWRWAWASDMPC